MKAKLRLLFIGIAIVAIPCLFYLIQSSFSSTVVHQESWHNVHLRKLNQPFEWHSPGPGDEDQKEDSNSTSTIRKMQTCRNSVQGRQWIADDQGQVCDRLDLLSNGCCNANLTSTMKFSCDGCKNSTGCCDKFEFCISCCMNPVNKDELMSVLNEASVLSNLLLLSVSDQFELCLAKCRTSSRSVQHENLYIDPEMKYCYSKGPTSTVDTNSDS